MFFSRLGAKLVIVVATVAVIIYLVYFFTEKIFYNKNVFETELFESVPGDVNLILGFNTSPHSYTSLLHKFDLEKMDFIINFFVTAKVDFAISCFDDNRQVIQAKVTKEQEISFLQAVSNISENKKSLKKTINDLDITMIELKRDHFILLLIKNGIVSVSTNYDLLQSVGKLPVNESFYMKYKEGVGYWNELKRDPAMKLILNNDSVSKFFLIEDFPNSFFITGKIFSASNEKDISVKPEKTDIFYALSLGTIDSIHVDSLNTAIDNDEFYKFKVNKVDN